MGIVRSLWDAFTMEPINYSLPMDHPLLGSAMAVGESYPNLMPDPDRNPVGFERWVRNGANRAIAQGHRDGSAELSRGGGHMPKAKPRTNCRNCGASQTKNGQCAYCGSER